MTIVGRLKHSLFKLIVLRGEFMEITEAFSKVLRKYRIEANMSQEKLALQCDLDRTYIGLLERAQRQPTITTLFALAEQLNVSTHQIIIEMEKLLMK